MNTNALSVANYFIDLAKEDNKPCLPVTGKQGVILNQSLP